MKTIIDHNPHIALSDLKELFRLSEGSASFTANGVQYTIVFSLEKQICVFLWEYNGKKKQEKIELRKEPSNSLRTHQLMRAQFVHAQGANVENYF